MMSCRNLNLMLVFVIFLACSVARGQADQFPPAAWSAECALEGKTFEISFRSQSGDWAEDDMLVSLKTTRGNTASLQLPQALYLRRGSVSNASNLCDLHDGIPPANTAAYHVRNTTVLFFLSKDNRPFFNTLVLALVDVETGDLLDVVDTEREIKDVDGSTALTIKKVDSGFLIRLVTEYFDVSDGPERYIEHWVPVTITANKINIRIPKGWNDRY